MAGIQNAEAVTDVFGYWPSFHDAEVVSLCLDRDPEHYARLEVKVHVWEMTPEVDAQGYFILKHHTLVHFRFLGLADLELQDFSRDNALDSLTIEDVTAIEQFVSFAVTFDAINGCDLFFKCQSAEVLSATPHTNQ